MTLGPFGPMSQQHADEEVRRVGERERMRGQGHTFGHDVLNIFFLLRRLGRRLLRLVGR